MSMNRRPKILWIPCLIVPIVLVVIVYFSHKSGHTDTDTDVFEPKIALPDVEQGNRLRVLRDFCKANDACQGEVCPLGKAPNAILVHEKYEVMWCDIGKVASPKLIWKMATFSGKQVNQNLTVHTENLLKEYGLRLLSSYSPEEQRDLLKKYYKFMFVRHPLLRLIAAYKDKFVNRSPDSALTKEARKELKEIRKNGADPDRLTFKEFVWLATNGSIRSNTHWVNYEERCQPCSINYDFIGHLNSFDEDLQKILALKYNAPISTLVNLDEKTRVKSKNGSLAIAKKYLSKLDSYQKLSVFKRFESDMKMFGYNWGGSGIV